MRETWFRFWAVPLVLYLAGCGGTTPDKVETPELEDTRLAWLEQLPSTAAPALGTWVWAAAPRVDGSLQIGVFEVVAVAEARADLIDGLGNRFLGVPGALMRQLSSDEAAAGDAVLAEVPGAGVMLAQKGTETSRVQVWWNGQIKDSTTAAIEKLEASSDQSFRPVAYRDEIGWQRGLLLASGDGTYWIHTPDGRVVSLGRDAVQDLTVSGEHWQQLAAGSEVMAYRWAHGYQPGVVREVQAAGLRFLVELEDGQEAAVFAFSELIPQPAPWESKDG